MSKENTPEISFNDLDLPESLLKTINKLGYEKPSPIQQATIPHLLEGKDVVGIAQTGTGKTAAFALPILSKIDSKQSKPQALILCPTRELAIQVAEAFQSYAANLKNFYVLPIYGGQDMRGQLRSLKRGAQIIVGTPGRTLDHLNRKSLDLSQISTLVLDEADEMLRMGFIDDVESILEKTSDSRQVVLFSATMPQQIRKVAKKYLNSPEEVKIESKTKTNDNIEQCYWLVQGTNKMDALTRILEVEDFDGMIVFVRTKTATAELADKLNARGFSASPLNGDMNQQLRQRTVEQLKRGKLDILVATDVAARGLDVERISHVFNYDIPYDNESYVHRIGRTGRAGRNGKAILFVSPRERHLLRSIERSTKKEIKRMDLPNRGELIEKRKRDFKSNINDILTRHNPEEFTSIVAELCQENETTSEQLASALIYLLQKDKPLFPPIVKEKPRNKERGERNSKSDFGRDKPSRRDRERGGDRGERKSRDDGYGEASAGKGMKCYRISVGKKDDASAKIIADTISDCTGLEHSSIKKIKLFESYTTLELPDNVSKDILSVMKKVEVCNRELNIRKASARPDSSRGSSSNHKKRKRRK